MSMNDDELEVLGALKLKDGIFIGDFISASDWDFISANRVTRIVNCSGGDVPNRFEGYEIGNTKLQYLSLSWQDEEGFLPFFKGGMPEASNELNNEFNDILNIYMFIEEAIIRGESALIHSDHGRSRCIIGVIIYLMMKYSWSLEKILEFITLRRPNLKLKKSFVQSLQMVQSKIEMLTGNPVTKDWNVTCEKAVNEDEIMLQNTFLNHFFSAENPPPDIKMIVFPPAKIKNNHRTTPSNRSGGIFKQGKSIKWSSDVTIQEMLSSGIMDRETAKLSTVSFYDYGTTTNVQEGTYNGLENVVKPLVVLKNDITNNNNNNTNTSNSLITSLKTAISNSVVSPASSSAAGSSLFSSSLVKTLPKLIPLNITGNKSFQNNTMPTNPTSNSSVQQINIASSSNNINNNNNNNISLDYINTQFSSSTLSTSTLSSAVIKGISKPIELSNVDVPLEPVAVPSAKMDVSSTGENPTHTLYDLATNAILRKPVLQEPSGGNPKAQTLTPNSSNMATNITHSLTPPSLMMMQPGSFSSALHPIASVQPSSEQVSAQSFSGEAFQLMPKKSETPTAFLSNPHGSSVTSNPAVPIVAKPDPISSVYPNNLSSAIQWSQPHHSVSASSSSGQAPETLARVDSLWRTPIERPREILSSGTDNSHPHASRVDRKTSGSFSVSSESTRSVINDEFQMRVHSFGPGKSSTPLAVPLPVLIDHRSSEVASSKSSGSFESAVTPSISTRQQIWYEPPTAPANYQTGPPTESIVIPQAPPRSSNPSIQIKSDLANSQRVDSNKDQLMNRSEQTTGPHRPPSPIILKKDIVDPSGSQFKSRLFDLPYYRDAYTKGPMASVPTRGSQISSTPIHQRGIGYPSSENRQETQFGILHNQKPSSPSIAARLLASFQKPSQGVNEPSRNNIVKATRSVLEQQTQGMQFSHVTPAKSGSGYPNSIGTVVRPASPVVSSKGVVGTTRPASPNHRTGLTSQSTTMSRPSSGAQLIPGSPQKVLNAQNIVKRLEKGLLPPSFIDSASKSSLTNSGLSNSSSSSNVMYSDGTTVKLHSVTPSSHLIRQRAPSPMASRNRPQWKF